jgi:hypothetical protein
MVTFDQQSKGLSFWFLKWRVRDELCRQFDPSRLNLVQLAEFPVRRFLRDIISPEEKNLDPVTLDMLVCETVEEFFTHRPLIKATVLGRHQIPD